MTVRSQADNLESSTAQDDSSSRDSAVMARRDIVVVSFLT